MNQGITVYTEGNCDGYCVSLMWLEEDRLDGQMLLLIVCSKGTSSRVHIGVDELSEVLHYSGWAGWSNPLSACVRQKRQRKDNLFLLFP